MPENTESSADAPTIYTADEFATVQADAEKWKGFSRTHETRAKENLARAEKAEADLNTAVEAAKAEALAEAESTYGPQLVRLAFEAESHGRGAKLEKLLEHTDLNKFVKEGQPDREAIRGLLDDIAPVQQADSGGLFQGARGGSQESHPALNGDPILQMLNQRFGINP